jgi:hypothetical protein
MRTDTRKLLEAELFEAQARIAKAMRSKLSPGAIEADSNLTLSMLLLQENTLIARLRKIQDVQQR